MSYLNGVLRLSAPVRWFGWEDTSSWVVMHPFPTAPRHISPLLQPALFSYPNRWALRKHNGGEDKWWWGWHSCTQHGSSDSCWIWPALPLAAHKRAWALLRWVCGHQASPNSMETVQHCSKEGSLNSFLCFSFQQGSQRIEESPNEPACNVPLLN